MEWTIWLVQTVCGVCPAGIEGKRYLNVCSGVRPCCQECFCQVFPNTQHIPPVSSSSSSSLAQYPSLLSFTPTAFPQSVDPPM
uniref:Uncharacterized protein n=1 Tax=Anguilla anguilla TaxID=7936 RepID=A0A0E9VED1_ANGAN